ncbi:MAG: transposase [Candidatus Lokiarchaeota archaeon]|nr:transposase [Candidatus Lokiarchaeota archaeon]
MCGKLISEELIRNYRNGGDKIYCESCGYLVSMDFSGEISPTPSEQREPVSEKENSPKENAKSRGKLISDIDSFFYRYAYQILMNSKICSLVWDKKKNIGLSQIRKYTDIMKDLILKHSFPAHWISRAATSQDKLLVQIEMVKKDLNHDQRYKAKVFPFLAEVIEVVFDLIVGNYKFRNLREKQQIQIIKDLKSTFGFRIGAQEYQTFRYCLSEWFAQEIYHKLQQSELDNSKGKEHSADIPDSETPSYHAMVSSLINKFMKNPSKYPTLQPYSRELKKFILRLTIDQFYYTSFVDYVRWLTRNLDAIRQAKQDLKDLNPLLNRLLNWLIFRSFIIDCRFPKKFKANLALILSRMIFIAVKRFAMDNKLNLRKLKVPDAFYKGVGNNLAHKVRKDRPIHNFHLLRLETISHEEFFNYYTRFQKILQEDKIYFLSFKKYVIGLTKLIRKHLTGTKERTQFNKFDHILHRELRYLDTIHPEKFLIKDKKGSLNNSSSIKDQNKIKDYSEIMALVGKDKVISLKNYSRRGRNFLLQYALAHLVNKPSVSLDTVGSDLFNSMENMAQFLKKKSGRRTDNIAAYMNSEAFPLLKSLTESQQNVVLYKTYRKTNPDEKPAIHYFTDKEQVKIFDEIMKIYFSSPQAIQLFKKFVLTIINIAHYCMTHGQTRISLHELQKTVLFTYGGLRERHVEKLISRAKQHPLIEPQFKPKGYSKKSIEITRKFSLHPLVMPNDNSNPSTKSERQYLKADIKHYMNQGLNLRKVYYERLKDFIRELYPHEIEGILQKRAELVAQQLRLHKIRKAVKTKRKTPKLTRKLESLKKVIATKEQELESYSLIKFFSSDPSETHIKGKFYNAFNLSQIAKTQEVRERFGRCLYEEVFHAARNMFIRIGRLHVLLKYFEDPQQLGKLIANKGMRSKALMDLLKYDIFGNFNPLSYAFVENHVRQLRNMLLAKLEFSTAEFRTLPEPNEGEEKQEEFVKNSLIQFLHNALNALKDNPKKYFSTVKTSLLTELNSQDLKEAFAKYKKYYKINIKRATIRTFKKIQKLRQNIAKIVHQEKNNQPLSKRQLRNKAKWIRHLNRLTKNLTQLLGFTEIDLSNWNLSQFKVERDHVLDSFENTLKDAIKTEFGAKPMAEVVQNLLKGVLAEELQIYLDPPSTDRKVLNHLFNARMPSLTVKTLDLVGLLSYIRTKMIRHLRTTFPEILFKGAFHLRKLGQIISRALGQLRESSLNLFDQIHFHSPTFSTAKDDDQVFLCNYDQKLIKLSYQRGKDNEFLLQLRDDDQRLNHLVEEDGAIPLSPTITVSGPKILLHQPFRIPIKARTHDEDTIKIVMGVDIGLKDFAVVSIRREGKEIARYFLNERTLFNYYFDSQRNGKVNKELVLKSPVRRLINNPSDKFSNVKNTLISLRKQQKTIQSKLDKLKGYYDQKYERIRTQLAALKKNDPKVLQELATILEELIESRKAGYSNYELPYSEFLPIIKQRLRKNQLGTKLDELKLNFSELKHLLYYLKNPGDNSRLTPRYRYKSEYNRLYRIQKSLDRRMQNLHSELVNLTSHHLVDLARLHEVTEIKFEDLRWSQHQRKDQIGYFLSSWQRHWFFSQIIQASTHLATQYSIKTLLVNPKATSYRCCKCGNEKKEDRQEKVFKCSQCGIQLDADLNAARNIAMVSSP